MVLLVLRHNAKVNRMFDKAAEPALRAEPVSLSNIRFNLLLSWNYAEILRSHL